MGRTIFTTAGTTSIYELTMDVFGVAFIIGCLLAMYRRAFRRKPEPRS